MSARGTCLLGRVACAEDHDGVELPVPRPRRVQRRRRDANRKGEGVCDCRSPLVDRDGEGDDAALAGASEASRRGNVRRIQRARDVGGAEPLRDAAVSASSSRWSCDEGVDLRAKGRATWGEHA